jgi:hypothetical protein
VLCTVVLESYGFDERKEVREALKVLTDPGQPDWSPMGCYCYWDRDNHDILYLGLTNDLPGRFAKHNGLVRQTSGNKWPELQAYFAEKPRIGFSVLMQSKAIAQMEALNEIDFTMGSQGKEVIAVGEGQLIETHRLVYGSRPRWNGPGGSVQGQRWATAAPALLELLSGRRDSLFAARWPLRIVAKDLGIRLKEATIHAARMRAVMDAHEVWQLPTPGTLDSAEVQERIMKSMKLRMGHLVDELDVSDSQIRDWMAKLGDPEHWRKEAAHHRAMAEEAIRESRGIGAKDREVFDYLDSLLEEAAPPQHILATRDMLEGGYLDRPLEVP